jgi:uncharacterized protein YkwD
MIRPLTGLLCLLIFLFHQPAFSQQPGSGPADKVCLSAEERMLFNQINAYREQKGLPPVKLSASLTKVAQTHARDQAENFTEQGKCNMHSWSAKGNWSSCCYTPDHKKGKCMWDKPRELTSYPGDGFEISFWSTNHYESADAAARDILNGWKNSRGHNEVIINAGIWKSLEWNALGVGIYGGYANAWFGKEADPAPDAEDCE